MLKRHFSYKVWFTFFLVVLLFSCRKEQASVSIPQEMVADRFFNEHRTNSTEEKQLIDYLSRLNEKKDFINKTVERIGFPHWDKLVKYSFLSNSSGRVASNSTGSSSKQDSATNYIIPFARDTQNNVNAAMFIKTDKGDTSISYLCDWQYSKFRTPAQISQANDIAMFFMLFDRKVYGHEKFDVLDSALFRKDNKKAITISFNNTDSSNTNGFSTYTCTSYTITYYHCPAPVGSCNGYQGECDGCFDYCRTDDSFTICNWVASVSPPGNDFGGGGTPPPDNGSGSNIGGSGNNDVAAPPSNNDGLRPGWKGTQSGGARYFDKTTSPGDYRYNKTNFDEETGDLDSKFLDGNYYNLNYTSYSFPDKFPTISPIIPESKFVGWDRVLHPGWECMDYATEQLRVMGYTISRYFAPNQTIQIYTEAAGPNDKLTKEAVGYLLSALKENIPVIVGVDNKAGSPNDATDKTTDHFIVIVGAGNENGVPFFLFYDNATNGPTGVSNNNRLYYLETLGTISGRSDVPHVNDPAYGRRFYTVTQIRKSKKN
jgi:hypothetical protein